MTLALPPRADFAPHWRRSKSDVRTRAGCRPRGIADKAQTADDVLDRREAVVATAAMEDAVGRIPTLQRSHRKKA